MGTSWHLGGQTWGHILKFWKNEKIHISPKLIILVSKTTCGDFI